MEELEKEPTLSLSNHKRLSDRVDLSDYSLQMSRSMDKVKDLLNSYIENLMATVSYSKQNLYLDVDLSIIPKVN